MSPKLVYSSTFGLGPRTVPFYIDANQLAPAEIDGTEVTLVVVDMQPGFLASLKEETLLAVERQIRLAVSRGWSVVLLELDPWRNGPTHERLTKLLDGYQRQTTRVKSVSCGAIQVQDACEDLWLPTRFFRVCGVNSDLCVRATVLGMHVRYPGSGIRVIREACNTDHCPDMPWRAFPDRDRGAVNVCVSSESIGPEF